MLKAERSTYTALDFIGWRESKTLVLAPKFQRRMVWTTSARSFLIDSLLRGMPVPPIYLRISQDRKKERIIREVVDGQQRISAVLDFIDGKYAISRTLDAPYAGKSIEELSQERQDQIKQYSFICEVFHGISDQEVLEIFARLNQYSVRLNAQELRNGKYFGYFKQSAYSLAHEHLEFWRRNRIFTNTGIARMKEVELTSELLILALDGLQDKKKSIDDFYEKLDDSFPNRRRVEDQFMGTIDVISDSLGELLRETQFQRPPLFYSLYGAVFHRLYGMPGLELPTPKKMLPRIEKQSLLSAVGKLSERIVFARDGEPVPRKYEKFVNACLRQTDNIRPRQTRLEGIYNEAF